MDSGQSIYSDTTEQPQQQHDSAEVGVIAVQVVLLARIRVICGLHTP